MSEFNKFDKFTKFFLSHPNLWFNASADEDRMITDLFSYLILTDCDLSILPILDQI